MKRFLLMVLLYRYFFVIQEDEDCLSDRMLTKKEFLEEKMTELKTLTLGSTNSEN
jgi:hypothetical protein